MDKIGKAEIDALLKMPFDIEIMGRLYYQARELLLSQGFDFFKPKEEERDKFIAILLDVTIKISAMQYHLKNYEQHEALCIEQIKAKCGADPFISLQAYELLFDLEAFMFQMKSALDLTVKFLEALFPNRFKTKTFGDMGENLIKGLEKFKKDKNAKKEIVDSIISMIRDDQKTWLKQAITLRTSLNHFKTIAGYNYQAKKCGNKWEIIAPRIAGIDVLTYMKTIYSNCLEFIQYFMCLVIGMFLPKPVSVGVRNSNVSSIGEPLNQYIKFGWGLSTISGDSSKSGADNINDQGNKAQQKNPADAK
jgi:hypothetical protein